VSLPVLAPSNLLRDALGELPPEIDLRLLGPGAEPGPEHLECRVLVLAAELSHLVPRLGELPALEVVQTLNAGVDWLMPMVPDGLTVCNASGPHDIPVAEWVVAVVLAQLHDLPRFAAAQAEGRWDTTGNALTTPPDQIPGDDLDGKRVTVVGMGSIGRAVARRLEPFGVELRGVTKHPQEGTHPPAALPELVGDTDVLVLLCPLTPDTRGLVTAELLAALPDGALVVNASRGAVLDQGALERELRAGRLRAALDVTDPEPLPEGHSLWTAPNVIITPHTAGSSRHWLHRAYGFVGDQLRRLAAGEPLRNVRTEY
jgi:phosphoglycerate dehydrogenase-like enzyme